MATLLPTIVVSYGTLKTTHIDIVPIKGKNLCDPCVKMFSLNLKNGSADFAFKLLL